MKFKINQVERDIPYEKLPKALIRPELKKLLKESIAKSLKYGSKLL
ncbi:MAG: hypothetical protein RBG13Loki_4209 [Promethearchaeota archaeon CR_4]|nr:MAG: hypothetical protein RBG13Loki_4209 [Candidatus Lokiarchaeota archaeon CR_4]